MTIQRGIVAMLIVAGWLSGLASGRVLWGDLAGAARLRAQSAELRASACELALDISEFARKRCPDPSKGEGVRCKLEGWLAPARAGDGALGIGYYPGVTAAGLRAGGGGFTPWQPLVDTDDDVMLVDLDGDSEIDVITAWPDPKPRRGCVTTCEVGPGGAL